MRERVEGGHECVDGVSNSKELIIFNLQFDASMLRSIFPIIICAIFPLIVESQSLQPLCSGSSMDGVMVKIEGFNDHIYATGFFTEVCGSDVGHVAEWADSAWVHPGFDLSQPGHSLYSLGDSLFIATYEEVADTNWLLMHHAGNTIKVGGGVSLTTASGFSNVPNIYDVCVYNGDVIMCGEFDRVGDENIYGIARWDGSAWNPLDSGLNGHIQATAPVMYPHQLHVWDGDLYVVGNFELAGGNICNGVARWDGDSWSSLGEGFDGTVYAVVDYLGELWVAGSFTSSGNTPLDRIAKWNGVEWEHPGFGFILKDLWDYPYVHTLYSTDDVLHIGGGLKKLVSPSDTLICGGLVTYSDGVLETYGGGVENIDIEAIWKKDHQSLLVGGGVFGSGYTGIIEPPLGSTEVPAAGKNVCRVFPNPCRERCRLDLLGEFQNAQQLIVLSVTGARMMTISPSDDRSSFSVDGLPPGVYLLQVVGSHSQEFVKFIVTK